MGNINEKLIQMNITMNRFVGAALVAASTGTKNISEPVVPRRRTSIHDPKLLSAAAAMLLAAATVSGQIVSNSEPASAFGNLGQANPAITNNAQACAPTATIDSLTYLAATFPKAFTNLPKGNGPPFGPSAVNILQADMQTTTENGTTQTHMVSGTQQFLGSAPVTVYGQAWGANVAASGAAQDLANLLGKKQDVEIVPDTNLGVNSGHYVCLISIVYNTNLNTGTVTFLDTLAGESDGNSPTNALLITATLTNNGGGPLCLTNFVLPMGYSNYAETSDFIGGYVEESVRTPDLESTGLMLAVVVPGLVSLRRTLCRRMDPE